jgi:hypothetical protein
VLLCNEHDILLSKEVIDKARRAGLKKNHNLIDIGIAEALSQNDSQRLAHCIALLERQQDIVHAARMRIVLGERTRDLTQLELARSVLQQLGDQKFLQRLTEVENKLSMSYSVDEVV